MGTLAALLASVPAIAEPYLPPSDDTVLQVLARPLAGGIRLERARDTLAAKHSDPDRAAELAASYLEANAATGEPRYLGYAKKTLEPWSADAQPPLHIWLLRARIEQRLHSFAAARADLEALLRAHPDAGEAAMLLSTVALVQGDYAAADEGCAALRHQGAALMAQICAANRAQYGGSASQSLRTLTVLLDAGAIPPGSIEVWARTLAAELAVGVGDNAAALAHYRRAIDESQREDSPDLYLLGSYADFLTDMNEPAAALEALRDAPATDAVLIRRAVAMPEGEERAALVTVLRERMTDLAARGDAEHAREQAWFHLHVARDPATALAHASRNWQTQHEMRDARLLLEAAVAAEDKSAAQPVVEWARAHEIRYQWLDALVAQVAREPKID